MQKKFFLIPLINFFNSTHLSWSIMRTTSISFCSTFFWNVSFLNFKTLGKNREITLRYPTSFHKLTIKQSRFEKNLKQERKINKQSYILNWKLKVWFLKTQIYLNFLRFSLVTFHWKSQLLNLHQLNILCFCSTNLTELYNLYLFLFYLFYLIGISFLHHINFTYCLWIQFLFHILFVCMNPFLHCSLFSKWDNGGSRFHIPLLESMKELYQPKYLNFSLVRIWTEYRWGNHQIRGKHLNHCAVEALLADFYCWSGSRARAKTTLILIKCVFIDGRIDNECGSKSTLLHK